MMVYSDDVNDTCSDFVSDDLTCDYLEYAGYDCDGVELCSE